MPSDNVNLFNGLRTDTPPEKCPANFSPDCSDMVFVPGGTATRPPFVISVTMPAGIVYRKEFTCKNGTVQILALDVNGVLYVVHADGTYTQIDTVKAGSSVNSVTAYGREYMAFFDANGGSDAPRQWDGKLLSRVTQDAPGAVPTFSANAVTSDSYAVTSIQQPPPQTRGYSYFLQSNGPGSSSPGDICTIYYSDATTATADPDLVTAFNSGQPVYLYLSFTGTPVVQGPYTVVITSIGEAQPPGQPRNFYYFTYQATSNSFTYYAGSGHAGYTVNYQRSQATLTSAVPVPDLAVGGAMTVSGSSVTSWNNTWTVTGTPDSGSMNISQTSLIGGVATFDYVVVSGVAPRAGQLVTITNTLNANGILNVKQQPIATATGGAVGAFTISGLSAAQDYALIADTGDAGTSGSIFIFDPGQSVLGTATSPIYGNATGGSLIFSGAQNVLIASGKRQAVVFYIIGEDDSFTAVSRRYSFTIPANTASIKATNLPIGPGSVKALGVAFTGANGSTFHYMDLPAQVNGVISGTSTRVDGNTSSTAVFQFTDDALLAGQAIDIPGNNLFQQVTLNTPRGVAWFQDRMFWWGDLNTVQNLQNMGMAGGTLAGSTAPLGWTALGHGAVQQIGSMPAYVVTGPDAGEIQQGAATTDLGVAILQSTLSYSLRLWMKHTGATGQMIASIVSASAPFASTLVYDLATLAQDGYLTLPFGTAMPAVIPADLMLDIKFEGLPAGQQAIIRDLRLVYADNPNRNPLARASYVGNPDAFDQLTGNIGPNDDTSELRCLFVLRESLHFVTARRLYDVQPIGNSEPSSWEPNQVADDCGAFNANSAIVGRGWAAWAGPLGAFWYSGGLPNRISTTIAPTWRGISNITNVYNDADAERVYFGTVTANHTLTQILPGVYQSTPSPYGLLTYDYHEVGLGGSGKWCPWKRGVAWIGRAAAGTTFVIGNSFFTLSMVPGVTDGGTLGPIGGYYVFGPLGASMYQKLFTYMGLRITGMGPLTPFLYAQTLAKLTNTLRAQELSALIDTVAEWPTDSQNGRLLFLKLGQPGVQFSLTDVTVLWRDNPNAPLAGAR